MQNLIPSSTDVASFRCAKLTSHLVHRQLQQSVVVAAMGPQI
jgi:hypothetical protein